MNPAEAAQLLAHAAAFDNRKPSEAASKAWAAALHDVPFDEDATAAIARYYGTEDPQATGQRWIQPHHVRTHRRTLRDGRLNARPLPAPPPELADNEIAYRGQLKQIVARAGNGAMPFRAIEAGGGTEPADAYLAARPRALHAERDRQTAETPEEIRRRQVTEAYGYLLAIETDAARGAVAQAREQLGEAATQDEVAILAATLTDAAPLPPARPDKATADLLAAQGCPYGCPLGEHVKACFYAGA